MLLVNILGVTAEVINNITRTISAILASPRFYARLLAVCSRNLGYSGACSYETKLGGVGNGISTKRRQG